MQIISSWWRRCRLSKGRVTTYRFFFVFVGLDVIEHNHKPDGCALCFWWEHRASSAPAISETVLGTLWGRSGDALRRSGVALGRSGNALGTLCDALGTLWGRSGDALGTLWDALRRSGEALEHSVILWDALGTLRIALGTLWDAPGTLWDAPGML